MLCQILQSLFADCCLLLLCRLCRFLRYDCVLWGSSLFLIVRLRLDVGGGWRRFVFVEEQESEFGLFCIGKNTVHVGPARGDGVDELVDFGQGHLASLLAALLGSPVQDSFCSIS